MLVCEISRGIQSKSTAQEKEKKKKRNLIEDSS
jgi:hypothetical protein